MKLSTVAVSLLGLASRAAADYMTVLGSCPFDDWYPCDWTQGIWRSSYGNYYISGEGGCHDPAYVPGMNQLCLDFWHNRGHFYFDGQGKRCLSLFSSLNIGSCKQDNWCYYIQRWEEVTCTW